MDLEGTTVSKISQNRLILYDFDYMGNLENKWTDVTKQKQSHGQNKQVVARGNHWQEGKSKIGEEVKDVQNK